MIAPDPALDPLINTDEDRLHPDDLDIDDEDDLGQEQSPAASTSPAPGSRRKISDGTRAMYMSYIKTLRKQVAASLNNVFIDDIRPTDLADHLINRATTLRPKTAINYRAGLMYWLDTLPQTSDVLHARLSLQVAFPKRGFKPARADGKPDSLYSRKAMHSRSFARAKFDKLMAELNRRADPTRRRARRAQELIAWLQAGLASGLRPIEWETARWENQDEGLLRVMTAKRKLDNYALPHISHLAPPPQSQIRFVPIDEADRIWVDLHLRFVKRHLLEGHHFKSYYDNNRVFLHSVSREVFGPQAQPFTLYMMRGQFAANRKRRGIPQDQVSAIMGTSSENADAYYGKSRHAHRGKGVGPLPPAKPPRVIPVVAPKKLSSPTSGNP